MQRFNDLLTLLLLFLNRGLIRVQETIKIRIVYESFWAYEI